jgi:hypothetical protein
MSALGPIELLFLLAPLAVVPLGLGLVVPPGLPPGRALALARRLRPWAALAVVASFFVHRGALAALLALPWLVVTLLVAAHGAGRFRSDGGRWAERTIDAGCVMLPIGAGWLLASRLGLTPMGFQEPIVLLTAVHFHYAAFAALMMVGLAGRAAGEGGLYRPMAASAVAGPPLLAAGITLSPLLEAAAGTVQVVAMSALALFTLARVVSKERGVVRLLHAVSAASLLGGMACALAYAVRDITGTPIISLAQMARIHGPLNGLGFALCGLIGWALARRNFPPRAL